MDITVLRSITTLVSFLTFVGIIVWAFKRSNRAAFDDAAQLPFLDEAPKLSGSSHIGSRP